MCVLTCTVSPLCGHGVNSSVQQLYMINMDIQNVEGS